MTDMRQAAQQALEALRGAREAVEHWASYAPEYSRTKYVLQDDLNAIEAQIDALKAALEEPQEPVGWFESPHGDFRANPLYKQEFPSSLLAWRIPLFIAPPQLQADAERYRWMKNSPKGASVAQLFPGEWDAAIDAERGEK